MSEVCEERGVRGAGGTGHTERSRAMEPGPRVGKPRGKEPQGKSWFYWAGEAAERKAEPWGEKRGVRGEHWPSLLVRVRQCC